jgi:glutathione S-transferase
MYKLYWDAGTAAMAPHAALEEIGVPHQLIRVDLDKGEQRSDWYLRINPLGRVPALVEGDMAMYEAAAILMYLADRHPSARLAPPADSPRRGPYLQWLAYLTNTAQETMLHWLYPELYCDGPEAQAAVKAHAERRIAEVWSHLDRSLGGGPYLLGDALSAADLFLVMLCRWSRHLAKPAMTCANIRRTVDLVIARPAWQRMMTAQGITWSGQPPV